MSISKKIGSYLSDFIKSYSVPFTFIRIVKRHKLIPSTTGPRILALMIENDLTFFHRLFYLCQMQKYKSIDWVFARGDRYEKRSFFRDLPRNILANPFVDLKIKYLYLGVFGGKVRFGFCIRPTAPVLVKQLAVEMKKQVRKVEDLLSLTVQGILIGDLIYDSYLRNKPAPTLDINDPYMDDLFAYAAKVLIGFETLLNDEKYDFFISNYATYIDHGIPLRLCLKHKIPVICTGAPNQVLVQPTVDFPFHKRNFHKYKAWISEDKIDEVRALGRKVLEKRFSGEIDPVTGYMKVSSFSDSHGMELIRPTQRKCIIMAHDFFDSPHVYGKMLFPDYYKWLEFMLETGSKCKTHRFYVKPHPNAVMASKKYYEKLKVDYPEVIFLDPSISNTLIMRSNFDCIFTLHGTVGHEFPYAGLAAIGAGVSPHSSFSFCKEPSSIGELEELVINPSSVPDGNWREEVELFAGVHSWRMFKSNAQELFPQILDPKELLQNLEDSEKKLNDKINLIEDNFINLHAL